MTSSPRSAPGRPRSVAVDAAILDHALALFIEGGVQAVAFDQIAKRAGISRAAIYRRWRSREELLAFTLGRLREAAEQDFADWADRPLDEILDWFVEHTPRAMLNPTYRRLLSQSVGLAPEFAGLKAAYWNAFLKPRREAFGRIIAKARAEGRLGPGADPDLMQDMLTGTLLHRLLLDPAEPGEAALRTYLLDLLKAVGLRPVNVEGHAP